MTCFDKLRGLVYYDDATLKYMCVFDSEQKRLCKTWLTRRTLFRCIFAALLVPVAFGWGLFYSWVDFPQYLTNWGIVLVLMSLCFSAYMPYQQDYRKRPCLMASHHLLFSLALIIQLIVTVVYWTMLHKTVMQRNSHMKGACLYQWLAHTIPVFGIAYNFTVTDFLFYRGLKRLFMLILFCYLSLNFTMTMVTGNVTYWFLAWKDPMLSIIVILLCISGILIIINLLAFITEVLKNRTLPNDTD